MERAFEHEEDRRAADVAEFAQDGGAVADVGLTQFQFVTHHQQHLASAGVQNPAGKAVSFDVGGQEGLGKQCRGLFTGDLKERNASEAKRAIEVHDLIVKALTQVRAVSRGLYPVPPEPDGLMASLQQLAEQVTRDREVECVFEADSAVLISDRTLASHLYRIAQEAVNNALKHSGGTRIAIRLAATAQQVELSVRDNGAGLAPDTPASGLGLQTMRDRASLIGGQFVVETAAEGGVRLVCSVRRRRPIPPPVASKPPKLKTA